MHTIVLKVDDFVALAASRGHTSYEMQAAETGLGVATLHRIRNGEPASSTAIAAICATYGVEFGDVFEVRTATTARKTRMPSRRVKPVAA
ncbi:helix-turn-helix domain-containing protein [Streptomyces anthocyanicus]|uniref:helix-turn-helix domain-containing protein n=1 Tax=Streptomyces anthocyanicus TaxID=68174 RepID=UPI003662652A